MRIVRSTRRRAALPVCLTLFALLCAVGVGSAARALTWSDDLPVAGDGRHLWLAAPAAALPGEAPGPAVELLHANGEDDEPAWEPVTRLRGRLAALAAPASTPGERDPAGGGTDRLWLVFDGGAVVRVALRPGPLDDQWFFSKRPVTNLPAGLKVTAAAAAGDTLWVLGYTNDADVFTGFDAAGTDGEATSRVAGDGNAGGDTELLNLLLGLPRPLESGPTLEAEAEAEAGAAAQDAGVAVEPLTTAATDADPSSASGSVSGPEPTAPAGPPATPSVAPSTATPGRVTELLLAYRAGRWQRVPLPVGSAGAGAEVGTGTGAGSGSADAATATGPEEAVALVPPGPADADADLPRPTRLARTRLDGRAVLVSTAPVGPDAWERVVIDGDAGTAVRALRVDGQLVVVRQVSLTPGTVEAAVLRGSRLATLGPLTVEPADPGDQTAAAWGAVPLAGGVGVVSAPAGAAVAVANRLTQRSADEPPALSLGVIDLQGRVTRDPAPMGLEPARPFADAADYLLMLAAVIGATLLLFSFWRRDPASNLPQLPERLVVADLWRRAVGGFIDLAISGAVVSGAMGLTAEELTKRWPGRGRGDTLEFILPGLLLIGLTVLHTTVTELLTVPLGRQGARAHPADRPDRETPLGRPASLVRGLLKPFDLIAYLLLVLPVVNPGRQRLADLIARTLVVKRKSEVRSPKSGVGSIRSSKCEVPSSKFEVRSGKREDWREN